MTTVPNPSGAGIEHFANSEFDVEFLPAGESFQAVAPGLARGLSFKDAHTMLRTLPEDEKGTVLVRCRSANGVEQYREVLFVTEPGLYRVIGQRQAARIKNPEIRAQVERFQRWVFHDVLPTLRKQGRHELPGGDRVHGSLPSTLSWEAAAAIGRAHHGLGMSEADWKRILKSASVLKLNGAPRAKYEDLFWPTDTRWEIHAHAVQFLVGTAMVTVRRMQAAAENVQMLLELDAIGREFPAIEGGES